MVRDVIQQEPEEATPEETKRPPCEKRAPSCEVASLERPEDQAQYACQHDQKQKTAVATEGGVRRVDAKPVQDQRETVSGRTICHKVKPPPAPVLQGARLPAPDVASASFLSFHAR